MRPPDPILSLLVRGVGHKGSHEEQVERANGDARRVQEAHLAKREERTPSPPVGDPQETKGAEIRTIPTAFQNGAKTYHHWTMGSAEIPTIPRPDCFPELRKDR